MTTFYISRKIVESALAALGIDDPEDAIRPDYSGRYMYGDRCLGVVLPAASIGAFGAELAYAAINCEADDVRGMLLDARTDNMARDTILYFPGVLLTDD